jgi:PAS domain S-box-containing protein
VLAQGMYQTAYYLICTTLGVVILGMAADGWRRLRTDEYRRITVAAGVLVLGRIVVLLTLLVGWLPGRTCQEWALQGLTLTAFIWAYLFRVFSSRRQAVVFAAVASATVGLSLSLCLLAGSKTPPFLAPLSPGAVALLLLSGFALFQWLRRRQQLSLGLGGAFLVSLLGAGSGLAGLQGAAQLAHLAVLTLLAMETYRAIMTDFSAFGLELQAVSDQALYQTQTMAFLLEVSQAIAASLDLPVVLERVAEAIARAVDADWAYILLPADDPEELTVVARYGWWGRRWMQDSQVQKRLVVRLADFPLLRHAILRRRQVLANQPEDYEQFKHLHDRLTRPQSGPTLIQPIHLQDRSLGALLLGHVGGGRTFGEADGKLCHSLIAQVAAAIDNARLYQSVDEQARRLAGLLRMRQEEATQRQAILESIADGVIVSGQAGEVVLVNAAAERILGLSRQQLLRQPIKWLYVKLLQGMGKRAGEQAVFEWNGKMVMGSLAPVKMLDGALLGHVAVFRDVTREQQAERAKSEFVAAISHELRTPMTSIKGYSDLLAAGAAGHVTTQQRGFLDVVSANAERMIGLVNKLIAVSEMERGLVQIETRPVDMGQIIEEAVQAVHSQAVGCQLELTVNLPPDLSPVRGDPQYLRQIMDNLLDNAVRYTPAKGRVAVWAAEAHLEDGGASPQHYLVVNVRDTGVGIPQQEHGRIFEKFYRVDNPLSLQAGGTGMGLAIVKSLVIAHGGRVWVESQPGAGSTFSFIIPTVT